MAIAWSLNGPPFWNSLGDCLIKLIDLGSSCCHKSRGVRRDVDARRVFTVEIVSLPRPNGDRSHRGGTFDDSSTGLRGSLKFSTRTLFCFFFYGAPVLTFYFRIHFNYYIYFPLVLIFIFLVLWSLCNEFICIIETDCSFMEI